MISKNKNTVFNKIVDFLYQASSQQIQLQRATTGATFCRFRNRYELKAKDLLTGTTQL